jgi:hypothetical protein
MAPMVVVRMLLGISFYKRGNGFHDVDACYDTLRRPWLLYINAA